MAKKTTLNDLAHLIEKGLAAVAGDIADIKRDMATKADLADLTHELKGDIGRVQQQVNSIEAHLRETKIEVRLGNLEEKVFGAPRR